jgi:hypothetical protein
MARHARAFFAPGVKRDATEILWIAAACDGWQAGPTISDFGLSVHFPDNYVRLKLIISETEMAKSIPPLNAKDDARGVSAREKILSLARAHGVVYQPNPLDDLGNAITRLAGDDVQLDDTELLLLALEREGYVSHQEANHLHLTYMRQRTP